MNKNYRNFVVFFAVLFVVFAFFAIVFENFDIFEKNGEIGEHTNNANDNISVNDVLGPSLVKGLGGLALISLFGMIIAGCIGASKQRN